MADRQLVVDKASNSQLDRVLAGVSLSGIDLSGLNLVRLAMHDLDFRGAICRGTVFPPLVDCVLDNVNAHGAHFTRLERCQLRGGILPDVLLGARMLQCTFDGCDLRGARMAQNTADIHAHFGGNSFADCNLEGADFAGAMLEGTSFRGSRFDNGRLARSNLRKTDLRDCGLAGANLVGADLTGAMMDGASLSDCTIDPEQVQSLGRVRGTGRVSVLSRKPGLATERLTTRLSAIPDYDLRWAHRHMFTGRIERVLIWRDDVVAKAAGIGSFSAERVGIRTYPLEPDLGLRGALADVAADYANWPVVESSIELEVGSSPAADDSLVKLAHAALTELFIVE